jgi:hypothetical protein
MVPKHRWNRNKLLNTKVEAYLQTCCTYLFSKLVNCNIAWSTNQNLFIASPDQLKQLQDKVVKTVQRGQNMDGTTKSKDFSDYLTLALLCQMIDNRCRGHCLPSPRRPLYQAHWLLQHTLDSIHLHMIHEGSQLVP